MFPSSARAAGKPYAEWCQCAIFVVNHLGLEIIPGDYYTAGSFVAPDASGKTWMEYQGFGPRADGENAQKGDVIVIRPNGRVFIPEGSEGSRLMEVNAAWTGHIGVIETAKAETVDGKEYRHLSFLSSNWGVNAGPMFVRSGCFNVDRSEVWVEKDDADISFWRAVDVPLQRRHILNIANQLTNGYYHVGIDGTADGFPISGPGLIGYAWNLDWVADQGFEAILTRNGSEIPLASLQAGDALFLEDGVDVFYGIYAGQETAEEGLGEWYSRGTAYWFDPSSAALQGPRALSELIEPAQAAKLRAFRSGEIRPLLEVDTFEIVQGQNGDVYGSFILKNQGGQTIQVKSAEAQLSTLQGRRMANDETGMVQGIEIPPGQEFSYYLRLEIAQNGVYIVQPVIDVGNKKEYFPEFGKILYFKANLD